MIVDLTLTAPAGADDASMTTGPPPSPQEPLPGMSDDSTAITAGLGGFLVVFALGLAVWFLGRDLTRRLRRMSRAEEQRVAGRTADDGPEGRDPVG
jgi:hypothetical protein